MVSPCELRRLPIKMTVSGFVENALNLAGAGGVDLDGLGLMAYFAQCATPSLSRRLKRRSAPAAVRIGSRHRPAAMVRLLFGRCDSRKHTLPPILRTLRFSAGLRGFSLPVSRQRKFRLRSRARTREILHAERHPCPRARHCRSNCAPRPDADDRKVLTRGH